MLFKDPPSSVLIVCAQRLGDVLLTTPLINSLKKSWPSTEIDILVFQGSHEILAYNPAIRHILTFPSSGTWKETFSFLRLLWNQYDLALSIQTGDRSIFYSYIAGKKCIGPLAPYTRGKWWKRLVLDEKLSFDSQNTHTILQNLKIVKNLGLKPFYPVQLHWRKESEEILRRKADINLDRPFIILHTVPRFKYKRWHQQGWIEVAEWLNEQQIQVVFTGGPCAHEQEYIQQICSKISFPSLNIAGKLTWAEVSFLLTKATAYVGVDTATTHMAAASGTPTIAIFGPTPAAIWGPWPFEYNKHYPPFLAKGCQTVKNVTILQTESLACVPCFQEGCDRHANSDSHCLNILTSEKVIQTLQSLLHAKEEHLN